MRVSLAKSMTPALLMLSGVLLMALVPNLPVAVVVPVLERVA